MNMYNNTWNCENEDESVDFHRPTEEEYIQAKEDMDTFGRWMRLSLDKQRELIDALIIERQNEKTYSTLYEQKKDICRMYEICLEVDNNAKSEGTKKNEPSSDDKHTT